jgi:hypothetical protein
VSTEKKPGVVELLIRDRFRMYELAALYHEDQERLEEIFRAMHEGPMRLEIVAESKRIRSEHKVLGHVNSALAVMRVLVKRVRADTAAMRKHLSDNALTFESAEVPEVLRSFLDGIVERLGEVSGDELKECVSDAA